MADWKARFLPGSFRGVPFFVSSHELTGGRHAKSHEPPNRNFNSAEDIGRKGKVFKIEAHVLSDNVFFERDGLVNAMDEQGIGTLIHPWLGAKEVQPLGYVLGESQAEGRMARLTLTFVEAGKPSFPFAAIDAVTDFLTDAVTLVNQVKNAFQVAFSVAQLPAFAVESAQSLISDFRTTIQDGFSNTSLNGTQHSELIRKTDEMEANKGTLVQNPASLVNEIDGTIEGLKLLVPDPPDSFTIDSTAGRDDKLSVFDDLLVFNDAAEDLPETTPTRRAEKRNALAFKDAIQQIATARLAEQIIEKEFNSINEALEQRGKVTDSVDKQILKARIDDDTFQALRSFSAKLVRALPNSRTTTGQIKEITRLTPIPTLVLSYNLYESSDNELDIIRRNKIRNPAFAVGDLEVIVGSS